MPAYGLYAQRSGCERAEPINMFIERVQREMVVMRRAAGRRAWTTVANGFKIVSPLHRTLRNQCIASRTSACRQLHDVAGDVENHPMPPPLAVARIRVEDSQRECRRVGRCAFPLKFRRCVTASAAVACISVPIWNGSPVVESGACERKRRMCGLDSKRRDDSHRSHLNKCNHWVISRYL